METKKSVVKEIKNLNKKDSYGNSSFVVTLENGDSGFYACKADLPKFKVGEELEYEFEAKPRKDGSGTYNKISLPKSEDFQKKSGSNYVRQPRTKQDVRSDVPFRAMDKCVDMVIAGKVAWEKYKEYYKELCTYLYDEIDDCFAESGGESK